MSATGPQRSLKALVSERNSERNSSATGAISTPETVQQSPLPASPVVASEVAPVAALALHAGSYACDGCQHIRMIEERRDSNARRFFWFKCAKGHAIIEAAYHGERVLVAPASCGDYDAMARH